MRNLICVLMCFSVLANVCAEKHYCWSINGLNVRETPSPSGKIMGKIEYGQHLDLDLSNQDFTLHHEDLFLIGKPKNEQEKADIMIHGTWLAFEFKGKKGYIFSGYLSRFPTFKIQKTDGEITAESHKQYLASNYKLLNQSMEVWDSSIFDDERRTYFWDEGIMIVNEHSDKGHVETLVLSKMTMNEALLFVKFYFQIFDSRIPKKKSELISSDHFYGLLYSDDYYAEKVVINYPAPEGDIVIERIGSIILIRIHGSC